MRRLTATIAVAILVAACGDGSGELSGETTTAAPADVSATRDNEPDDTVAPVTTSTEGTVGEERSDDPQPTTSAPREGSDDDAAIPEPVPTTIGDPVTGEGPSDLVASIKADLIARTGASEADLVLVRSEEVIWNDGSLGCPVPGEFYTQAQVSGYWVVLEYNGVSYDYRASDRGFFRLCEGGGVAPPSNPTG